MEREWTNDTVVGGNTERKEKERTGNRTKLKSFILAWKVQRYRNIAGTTANDDDDDGHGRTTRDWELRRAYGRGVQTLKRCNTWWRAGFSPCARRVSRLFRVAVLAAVPQATMADHGQRIHKGRPVARESTPHPVDETRPPSQVRWRCDGFTFSFRHRHTAAVKTTAITRVYELGDSDSVTERIYNIIRRSDARRSCTSRYGA